MMDILNRNQRRSSVWRVAAILGVVVAVFFTVLTSMHQSYSNQGSGELQVLRDSLSNQMIRSAALANRLSQDTVRLSLQIEKLKNNDASQQKLDELNTDLEQCNSFLKDEERENRKLSKKVLDLEYELKLAKQ
jgi:hypothetical protein